MHRVASVRGEAWEMATLLIIGVFFSFCGAFLFGWATLLHPVLDQKAEQGLLILGKLCTGVYAGLVCVCLLHLACSLLA